MIGQRRALAIEIATGEAVGVFVGSGDLVAGEVVQAARVAATTAKRATRPTERVLEYIIVADLTYNLVL